MAKVAKPHRLPSGKWRIRWTDHKGQRQSATFLACAEAKAALHRENENVRAIKAGEKRATPPKRFFRELADEWLRLRALAKRSRDDDVSMLRRHLLPFFGEMAIGDIRFVHVEEFKAQQIGLAPQTLRHHLDLLGAMLRYAVDLEWLLAMPKIVKPKVRVCSKNYGYLKNPAEVRSVLEAALRRSDLHFAVYALAVHTGMRKGEIAGLTWDRVDLERGLISVDRSYAGPTKADDWRNVPINDVLMKVLRWWRGKSTGQHVFVNRAGKPLDEYSRVFDTDFHKVLDAAGFARPNVKGKRHVLRFHDLRHTFASLFMGKVPDLFQLQKILGHKTTALTLRYAHLAPEQFAKVKGVFGDFEVGGGGFLV